MQETAAEQSRLLRWGLQLKWRLRCRRDHSELQNHLLLRKIHRVMFLPEQSSTSHQVARASVRWRRRWRAAKKQQERVTTSQDLDPKRSQQARVNWKYEPWPVLLHSLRKAFKAWIFQHTFIHFLYFSFPGHRELVSVSSCHSESGVGGTWTTTHFLTHNGQL